MQMKYLRLLVIATFVAQLTYAQGIEFGVFAGTSAYSGDLVSNSFLPKKMVRPAVGINANLALTNRINLRSGITYGRLSGSDKYANDPGRVGRNLSFETSLFEFHTTGELYLLDIESTSFSPYGFVGAALFHFNPYAHDQNGNKVFLRPLSTEGQGLAAYPDRKPYSLWQFGIPYGGGIKIKVNDQLKIAFEIGLRKLFTEYIDDVSTQYVDWDELMNAKGPLAVEMAYRGDELDHGIGNSILPYPSAGTLRGDPSNNDAYYVSGLNIFYKFNPNNPGTYGGRGRKRSKTGCPVNVY